MDGADDLDDLSGVGRDGKGLLTENPLDLIVLDNQKKSLDCQG
jgi:hypothetical protein